jgi:transcriptional repressor NrdR
VRCPACDHGDTKVVDSRAVEGGAAIRRRRLCASCDFRFTTFERIEVVKLVVTKRSGARQPFDGQKILRGLAAAAKGRPVAPGVFEAMVDSIEEAARMEGGDVTSEWVGLAVLERLRAIDPVTCLRFASVYKDFNDIGDFEREMSLIKLEPASD